MVAFRADVLVQIWRTQAAVKRMKPGAAIANTTNGQAKAASLPIRVSNLLVSKGSRMNCVAPVPVGHRSRRSPSRYMSD